MVLIISPLGKRKNVKTKNPKKIYDSKVWKPILTDLRSNTVSLTSRSTSYTGLLVFRSGMKFIKYFC